MSSQSSRFSRRSRQAAPRWDLLCRHGNRLVLRTSGTKENPGRRFWGCVHYDVQNECDFFKWADAETDIEDPQIARLRKKVACLKTKIKDSEWKLKVVAVVGLLGWVGFTYVWMSMGCNVWQLQGLSKSFG
ncbi:hypothetical protein PIB30_053897 [Stylosanthes scabra]|uniref:GRF-type domain-containing protein n=1 Tax=Stylosanthes scabra TaxID=79078 RepID=A0ABU6WIG9_9FABA|nr:hypothetical protein [Stylosanthes scabra]